MRTKAQPVQLKRDPFARCTLMRERGAPGECHYCGRLGRRFIYCDESDGDNTCRARDSARRFAHAFCSVGCYRWFSG